MTREKYVKLFISVCRQPLIAVQSKTFECVCAYIDGYNMATCGGCLAGFRHWLLSEGDKWTNLPWWGVVRRLCFPNDDPAGDLTETQSEQALEALAEFLERYLDCFLRGGLELVFHKYNTWMLTRTDEATAFLRHRLQFPSW